MPEAAELAESLQDTVSEDRLWNAASAVAGLAATLAVRRLVSRAWRARTGDDPPSNPAQPGVTWSRAIAWSVATGIGVAVARTIAQRGAARAWAKATGKVPPGLQEA